MGMVTPRRSGARDDASWIVLYCVSVLLHLPGMLARAFMFYLGSWAVLALGGWAERPEAHTIGLLVGFGPLAWSALTLAVPLGVGLLWRIEAGGREPSARERDAYEQAVTELRQADPSVRLPADWFVTDELVPNAAGLGDTVMFTRGLVDSGYLTAVLAHELGHTNTSDARLAAALHRLEFMPSLYGCRGGRGLLHQFTGLWTGVFGSWLMSHVWAAWFRSREYQADAYAAGLGQGERLAEMLELHVLPDDGPIPFRWLSGPSHPPTELRLDRLAASDHQLRERH